MPTVTLDLPELHAARLLSMPEPERNRYVTELLDDDDKEIAFTTDPYDFTPINLNDLSPDDKTAVLRGLADVEAGRVLPPQEIIAQIEMNFNEWAAAYGR